MAILSDFANCPKNGHYVFIVHYELLELSTVTQPAAVLLVMTGRLWLDNVAVNDALSRRC